MSETMNPHETSPAKFLGTPGNMMGYKVVAMNWPQTWGDKPIWCAYMGPTDWPDEQVVKQGNALTKEQAFALFPIMTWVVDETLYTNP